MKIFLMAAILATLAVFPSKAEAQFSQYTRTTQFICNASTITPTLCVDLSSAPYSGNVFGSFVVYADTTTTTSIIRVDSSSDTISTTGVPVTDDKIRWFSYDQAQLIFKGKIWAFTEGTASTQLLIGIGRPDY